MTPTPEYLQSVIRKRDKQIKELQADITRSTRAIDAPIYDKRLAVQSASLHKSEYEQLRKRCLELEETSPTQDNSDWHTGKPHVWSN